MFKLVFFDDFESMLLQKLEKYYNFIEREFYDRKAKNIQVKASFFADLILWSGKLGKKCKKYLVHSIDITSFSSISYFNKTGLEPVSRTCGTRPGQVFKLSTSGGLVHGVPMES